MSILCWLFVVLLFARTVWVHVLKPDPHIKAAHESMARKRAEFVAETGHEPDNHDELVRWIEKRDPGFFRD